MLKTAEAVTPKHPDKMCDQISDAILDWYLHRDPLARVAVETLGGHGKVYIVGEVTSTVEKIDMVTIDEIVQRVTGKDNLTKEVNIVSQSPEIANGVDTGGAGDQGIMVGYACNDNEEMVPMEYYLARSLAKYIYAEQPYDGKTQVTLEDGKVKTIVASFQNTEAATLRFLIGQWFNTLEEKGINIETVEYDNGFLGGGVHANPAGDWDMGGFDADTGLTGRKLMVDNYGPQVSIGGGAFSGKDATKVDRSAAYMARRIAVDIAHSNGFKEVVVKLAYAIGVAEPVMVSVKGTNKEGYVTEEGWDVSRYNLTPKGIIETLGLRNPQYEQTAQWGHFGNGFTWDK